MYLYIMRLYYACKEKGADQPAHCTADLRIFCFSPNQTTGFLSTRTLHFLVYLNCVKIAMPLELIFHNLHRKCGSIVFGLFQYESGPL